MPLPAPQARSHLHTRAVVFHGYHREDGLWDIEAELTDTKTYELERFERSDMPAGTPIHGMAIRVTVDDHLTIREIASAMDYTPFGECQQGTDPMQQMVGITMGPGWQMHRLGFRRPGGAAPLSPVCGLAAVKAQSLKKTRPDATWPAPSDWPWLGY